jgi:hypothetical protein
MQGHLTFLCGHKNYPPEWPTVIKSSFVYHSCAGWLLYYSIAWLLYAYTNLELNMWELGDDPVVLANEKVVDYRHACMQVHPTQKYVHNQNHVR